MRLYGSFDLHSTNNVATLIDEQDRLIFQKRLSNDIGPILKELEPYREPITGLVVESTYNWYWLVDGLEAAGYKLFLANPAAIQQYKGLKHTNDNTDGRWLANLLRLGILQVGHIYPKKERGIRDLLRKRGYLVHQHTSNINSIKTILSRNTGRTLSANKVKKLNEEGVEHLLGTGLEAMAVKSSLAVMVCLEEQIGKIEEELKGRLHLRASYRNLKSIPGVGDILGMTIMLETGDIGRFPTMGDYSSYCRCVKSDKVSNGKRKGKGNRKNGNQYLSWAFHEAATFAVRYNDRFQRFHQRKASKTHWRVADNAVANKLTKASYYIMRDGVVFDIDMAFR
jgi:transposase